MKHSDLPEQKHFHARALSFLDFRPQFAKQRHNIILPEVAEDRMGKDRLQSAFVLPFHQHLVPQYGTKSKSEFSLHRS